MTVEERLAIVETKVADLKDDIQTMADDVKAMRTTLDELNGGKKAAFVIWGGAATMGGLIVWAIQHVPAWLK